MTNIYCKTELNHQAIPALFIRESVKIHLLKKKAQGRSLITLHDRPPYFFKLLSS